MIKKVKSLLFLRIYNCIAAYYATFNIIFI